MVFVMRKLDRSPNTLGEKLRALRNGQAVTMDMMVRHTRVQRKYLEALERGDYAVLPEPLYTRNFIRAYARYLNADEHYFLELFDEECGRCDLPRTMITPRQRLKSLTMMAWHRLLGIGAVLVVISFLGLYIFNQFSTLTSPPDLLILNPASDIVTSDAFLKIEGRVEDDTSILINNTPIPIVGEDRFIFELPLEEGMNEVRIEAKRRYSRSAVVERRVIYKPEALPISRY